jgi:hypothetical protein
MTDETKRNVFTGFWMETSFKLLLFFFSSFYSFTLLLFSTWATVLPQFFLTLKTQFALYQTFLPQSFWHSFDTVLPQSFEITVLKKLSQTNRSPEIANGYCYCFLFCFTANYVTEQVSNKKGSIEAKVKANWSFFFSQIIDWTFINNLINFYYTVNMIKTTENN